ncbi:hypothetical protein GBAR_LOCUS186, partial [Geodia barretti]
AVVAFVTDEYTVNENEGAVSVCVDSRVTEGFEADLTVSLSATDGTASIDDDTELLAAEFTLVFPAGSSNGTRCSSIPITDDELLEGNHEFTVTLTGAGFHASIDTLSSVTTVTIIDDESLATISLQPTSATYAEGTVVNVCAEIQELPAGGLGTDITVDFLVEGFSAVEEEDFDILSPVSVVFNSSGNVTNGDNLCLGLSILEDDIYEEDQLLNVSIVSVSPSSAATVGTDKSAITIEDNGDLIVSLSATDGTASVVDDTGLPGAEFALVFPAGSSESIRCFTVPIVNDTLLEGTQEFTVTATDVGSHALINTPSSSTTISITDNECKTCDVYFSLHH